MTDTATPRTPAADGRQLLDAAVNEADFMWQIIQLARVCHWFCYHPYDSRRSAVGFPDLCCVHPERRLLCFLEIKRESGKTTAAQEAWLAALGAIPGVVAMVVRPSDFEMVAGILKGKQE
jgi:hypothetical protein